MQYKLPVLRYGYDALEPHFDALTMEIHHARHHAGYVERLNQLLQGHDKLLRMTLEDIVADIRSVPEEIRQAVRNYGGGHLNHSLFWQVLSPHCEGGEPGGALRDAINATFKDFASFQDEFVAAAAERFGSGWAWLCLDRHNAMEIISTPNQDSPIMLGLRPILGLDLWEHAYYLKYQNRRGDYVAAWWNLVDWEKVGELYALCTESLTHKE